jgi:hypothetical protein
MCKRCPLFWEDPLLRYVQVMCEEQSNDGQAALEGLLQLRRRVIENPSLVLDKETKRLRQANFKHQHKQRQERSNVELTEVDKEALMARDSHATSIFGFDVLSKIAALPNVAPRLYSHGHQQLPGSYSMTCDPLTAGTARPRGPLPLFKDQLSMQVATAQGMPAWQPPLERIFGVHNQAQPLCAGGAGHDSNLVMQSNQFNSAPHADGQHNGPLHDPLRIAPLAIRPPAQQPASQNDCRP